MDKPLKPSEHAEKKLIAAIMEKKYKPGDHLPGERELAEQLNITRPTLRETLKHLSAQGWLTIQQGKPTRINDYLKDGGLGLLGAMVRNGKTLSKEMILNLMEIRVVLFPGITEIAVAKAPDELIKKLVKAKDLDNRAKSFADFDWELQLLIVNLTENPVFRMILNDFSPLFETLAYHYFQHEESRKHSSGYYDMLLNSIDKQDNDEMNLNLSESAIIVKEAMKHAMEFWKLNY
ncbi:Regulatory protein GntR HTH [Desulfamplus magnetovallimortis]|uniref:Regulatory protein GntR HTH n=1 Tax=Desulfamplus magnetovallimortis TaxID=1246637 RepID=A0A1W1HBP2_9BACT|nr:GntR family transcriptional regulator [Desulfamplus magnetovallimortis]SLM29856.1 Regulatory protein GntR HTH [Desulfamplus magnetovallimortis]